MREGKGGKKLGGRYNINEIRGNPNSLDPVRINSKIDDDVVSGIYDKLIDNNSALAIQPELAKSYEVSDDGLTYTFHLRSDAYFHDNACFPGGKGRKFVASDVKYNFERVCDPTTITVGYWIFQDIVEGANAYFDSKAANGSVKEVTGFRAIDDTTFVVKLTMPYAPFLQHLTTSFGYIAPREAIEHYGKDYFQNPVGTGPFIFKEWVPDDHVLLLRNPNYWQIDEDGNRLPYLDEVKFFFIKDDKTLMAKFERGELDENFTIPTESFRNYVTPEKTIAAAYADKYELQHVPAMNSYFFDFNCSRAPFDNIALRRALSFAVDRVQIIKHVLKDAPHGPAVHGIVPPAFERYPIESVDGIEFNPDSALYWLAKAGYPEGKGMPSIKISVYNEPRPMQIAQAVQRMWEVHLGAKVELQIMQTSQLLQSSEDGTLDMWLTRWYADYPEVENFLNLLNGRLVPKDPKMKSYPNSTRWNSEEFNSHFYAALATTDEAQRYAQYAAAESVAAYEAPTIPLFYEEHYRLLQKYVRNNPLDPMNRLELKTVWFDK